MKRNPSKLYGYHVANLRELERAISNVARLAKAEIGADDPQRTLQSLIRLYAFLIGAWAECRLKKLLHEEFGFSDQDRTQIQSKPQQFEQWNETVEVAFRRHYKITRADLNAGTIGVVGAARRDALRDALESDLRIVIEIRNKLAHGQWIYPFTDDGITVASEKFKLINKEDLLSLQFKYATIGYLADAVHDLVVSPPTFERDFEVHYRRLSQARRNLRTRTYEDYKAKLIQSRLNARAALAKGIQRSSTVKKNRKEVGFKSKLKFLLILFRRAAQYWRG